MKKSSRQTAPYGRGSVTDWERRQSFLSRDREGAVDRFETIAIVGVGLIGGSFGLALKKAGFKGRIIGVSSKASIDAAFSAGAIDEALPLEQAAKAADLIYLAQPIARILETLPQLDSLVRPGALVTDAGSTKTAIVSRARETLSHCQYLGGHPLAGKESRGVLNADPNLFRDRTYVLTPYKEDDLLSPAAAQFLKWLNRIGARPIVETPENHDAVIAYTSHLPQLISTALARCLGDEFPSHLPPIWGPALIDSTRLALSPFDIWGDILKTNQPAIEAALASYISQLEQIRSRLSRPAELDETFQNAAKLAAALRGSG